MADNSDPNDKETLLPFSSSLYNGQSRNNRRVITATNMFGSILFFLLLLGIITFVVSGGMVINLVFQTPISYTPDIKTCTCDCWDRQFKGGYIDKQKWYRNVYFNMNRHTVWVFAWTLANVMLLERFAERALMCVFTGGLWKGIRWAVLFGGILSFYAMFYNWWITWNYINDEFYPLLATQLFFNFTELLPSALFFYLIHPTAYIPRLYLLLSLSTSLAHIFLSLSDQGWKHLLTGTGAKERDLMFIVGDVLGVIVVLYELLWRKGVAEVRGKALTVGEISTVVAVVVGLMIIYKIVKTIYGYNE